SSSGSLTINGTGIVDLNGKSASVAMLNGSPNGALTNAAVGTATLTVTNGGSYGGALNDGGAGKILAINVPTGTLSLSGTGTATGGITVASGAQLIASQTNGTTPMGAGSVTLTSSQLSLQ